MSVTLYHELPAAGSTVRVTMRLLGLARTDRFEAGRRRSPNAEHALTTNGDVPVVRQRRERMPSGLASAMEPAAVAERRFPALQEERLHLLTHAGSERDVEARCRLILTRETAP